MLILGGYTTITGKQMNTKQIPIEHTLDPGEAVLPPSAVDIMTNIVALSGTTEEPQSTSADTTDTSIATLVIGLIVVYFVIKLILRFLPWVLGLGLVIAFLTML
jgi:hypothetical protein